MTVDKSNTGSTTVVCNSEKLVRNQYLGSCKFISNKERISAVEKGDLLGPIYMHKYRSVCRSTVQTALETKRCLLLKGVGEPSVRLWSIQNS